MKVDILAIGVHPDDVELSIAGTLLRSIDQGKKVALLDLTAGELGTRGNAQIRMQEADKAAKLMGVVGRGQLGLADGFFRNTEENLRELIRVIRFFQPEIVLANAPKDRHPDHGRAAKLVNDACYLSGLLKIETQDETTGKTQERWRPKALYHYIQDYNLEADFVVDISDYMERKLEVIKAYKSQFFDPDSTEMNTPISTEGFLKFIRAKNRSYGRNAGFDYAEGLIAARTIGIKDLDVLF